MDEQNTKLKSFVERALPWIVLAILLLYTYAKFAEHPYSGFRLSTDGHVFVIFDNAGQPPLRRDDRVIQIGALRWDDFEADYRKTLFDGVQPGQVVPLIVERGNQRIAISWMYPGPNALEIIDLVVNEGWLAYVFWVVGTLTLLHLRPKDERWVLMIAFNYLTAVWLVIGSGVSFYHIFLGAIFLRMAVWLCVPVYLHFHWVYPKPFRKLPVLFTWGIYSAAVILAATEWFQILPPSAYFLGFLLAVGGSLLLFIAHVIFQAEARRDLRLLLIAALLALNSRDYRRRSGHIQYASHPFRCRDGRLTVPASSLLLCFVSASIRPVRVTGQPLDFHNHLPDFHWSNYGHTHDNRGSIDKICRQRPLVRCHRCYLDSLYFHMEFFQIPNVRRTILTEYPISPQ